MTNTTAMQGMLYRMLGSTREKASAIGIGSSHIDLNAVDEPLSIRIIRTAVDRGINFKENSNARVRIALFWDSKQQEAHG